ncbi:MAG TPA: phage holin family protein [Candidatus Krumholzibacteria bacterium]|nr:phage holin family protein [Candidatus Krumholzibacteria bacterium]
MEAGQLVNALVGIAIASVVGGAVIKIVSSLNLGLWVQGFVTAFIAAIVITVLGIAVRYVLAAIGVPNPGGIVGFVERLIVAAVILMIADKLLSGLTVHGFKGAIIAALAISVISWLLGLFLGAMGIPLVV